MKTAQALTVTQIAAAAGALAWICIEAVQHRKATGLGIASGILAGLVVITPAAGVVTPAGAVALGFIASALCYGAILLKNRLGYDDTLDVFGVHGIAGIAGALLLTFFIRAVDMPAGRDTLSQLAVQVLGVGVDDRLRGGRHDRAGGARAEGLRPAARHHGRDGGHGPRAARRARLRPAEPELASRWRHAR